VGEEAETAWHARGQGFKSPQLHPRSQALSGVDRPRIARLGQQIGSNRLQTHNESSPFLADIGFALNMFVVGSQVPVRDHSLRTALRIRVPHAVGDGLLSVPIEMRAEGMSLASEDMGDGGTSKTTLVIVSLSLSLSLSDRC
jgi:hypothetical protein